MRLYRGILLALTLALAPPLSGEAFAKKKSAQTSGKSGQGKKNDLPETKANDKKPSRKAKKVVKKAVKRTTLHEKFVALKRRYRLGEVSRRDMWAKLGMLHERGQALTSEDRVSLLQTQAGMLGEAGFPILAAIYASQAVKTSDKPLSNEMEPSWELLHKVSERRPIQNLLEIVADTTNLRGKDAPAFATDWNYFAGNSWSRKGDNAKALSHYAELKLTDRHFFPAKYQQAMILIDQGRLDDAEVALKSILNPQPHRMSPLGEGLRHDLVDYTYMALGRLYYERSRFPEAVKMYRSVRRESSNFYDALFEQSWAFFMGGFPMHSLGALHAVESPFYKDVFNPEAPILRALVHYWLCRYEDSRNALADFMEKHNDKVEALDQFLDRQRLDAETAYQLFENLVSGVSSESLGMPRSVLQTAAEKDSMLLVRDQYAAIVEEKRKLELRGIFGSRTGTEKPMEYLERWDSALRKDVGRKFLAELQDMKKDFERLYGQAQFLYVELLMSEKDQLLGKELHASSKITRVTDRVASGGWADKTQAWKDAKNGEYWWDEVGWYISRVDSQCKVTAATNGSAE